MRWNDLRSIPNFGALLKSNFFAGILVVIPFGVIVWILTAVLGVLWHLPKLLPESWQPQAYVSDPGMITLLDLSLTLGAALFLALGVSFVGWVSKQYLGRKVLEFMGELIQRIPVIRTVYSALDQLLKTMASGGGQQFSRVVYVEYPRRDCWTLAFVTGSSRTAVLPGANLNLYVPTTPNPTSGFYLIVPESEIRESQLSVEEAFRTILSLGIAQGSAHGR